LVALYYYLPVLLFLHLRLLLLLLPHLCLPSRVLLVLGLWN
jgi:hypothetical protein